MAIQEKRERRIVGNSGEDIFKSLNVVHDYIICEFCLSLKFAIHKGEDFTFYTISLMEIATHVVHADESLGGESGVVVFDALHDFIIEAFCFKRSKAVFIKLAFRF